MIKNAHPNSIVTHANLHLQPREEKILTAYYPHPSDPLTDRQVKEALGFQDMNQVRPRITTLVHKGILIECGRAKDYLTQEWVRLTKLFNGEHQLNLF